MQVFNFILQFTFFYVLDHDKILYIKLIKGKNHALYFICNNTGRYTFYYYEYTSRDYELQHIDNYSVQSTFLTGLIITAVAATSVIYDVESWSLTRQSVVHFLIMLVTVYPCLVFSGWFPTKSILDLVKIFGIFLVVGIILWTMSYMLFGKILK